MTVFTINFALHLYIIVKKEGFMAKKIYMTSLKGGTGVTTCAIGLGLALAAAGERTLIADGDRFYGAALVCGGCANMQTYTLGDYEKGACRAKQTLVPHPKTENLSFSSSLNLTDPTAADAAVAELDGLFDFILLDKLPTPYCDCAVIVTDPYLPSLKSADCCKAMLSDGGIRDVGLIVNKLNGGQIIGGEVMCAQEIATLLHLSLTAVIPEDLSLPLGGCKRTTSRAFRLAAEVVTDKSRNVCNVTRQYFGPVGYFKRKVRETL